MPRGQVFVLQDNRPPGRGALRDLIELRDLIGRVDRAWWPSWKPLSEPR